MVFQVLLDEYEDKLKTLERSKIYYSEDYCLGYYSAIHNMFSHLKLYCDDYNPSFRSPTSDEFKEFEYKTSLKDDKVKIKCALSSVIDYRNHKIPVYADEDGQCYFTILDGKEYSSGTYNPFAEFDLCDFVDEIIDKEIMDLKRKEG